MPNDACAFIVQDWAKRIVIEVDILWRCLVLLEVTSMSSILLSLSLCMFAVANALTSLIHDCIEWSSSDIPSGGADICSCMSSANESSMTECESIMADKSLIYMVKSVIGVTWAVLKHCGKMPDAREELKRSMREGRIESRHSIKSLEGMRSSSHDFWAEIRMHSFTVNCDTFSNEEKVAAVVPVTCVEVTCPEAMLALSFSTLLVKCLMKILWMSALG